MRERGGAGGNIKESECNEKEEGDITSQYVFVRKKEEHRVGIFLSVSKLCVRVCVCVKDKDKETIERERKKKEVEREREERKDNYINSR